MMLRAFLILSFFFMPIFGSAAHAGGSGVFIVNQPEHIAMEALVDLFSAQVSNHYDQVQVYRPSTQEKRNDEIISELTWMSEKDRKRFKALTRKIEINTLLNTQLNTVPNTVPNTVNEIPASELDEQAGFNKRMREVLDRQSEMKMKHMGRQLSKALQDSDVVDVMIFGHTNSDYEILKWVEPKSLLSKLRLVYNSGCKNLEDGAKYLASENKPGAQAYVGHPGTSCSPIFASSFLKCWTGYLSPFASKGQHLSECVKKGNDFLKLVLEGKAIVPAGVRAECVDRVTPDDRQTLETRLQKVYTATRAQIRGESELSTSWQPLAVCDHCSLSDEGTAEKKSIEQVQSSSVQIFRQLPVKPFAWEPRRIPVSEIAQLTVPDSTRTASARGVTYRFSGKLAHVRRGIAHLLDPSQRFRAGHSEEFQLHVDPRSFDPKTKAIEISRKLRRKKYRGVTAPGFIEALTEALQAAQ